MLGVPLSVLDLAPVQDGASHVEALAHTAALARRVEELGYRRFWVGEHHGMPGIASSAPAVLLAHLAAVTSSIRIGSGGVMLPNHAPVVVAEQFGTLNALNPGRVDLGIGRAPGTDQITALALRRSVEALSATGFPDELDLLLSYFDAPEGIPGVVAIPGRGDRPEVWILGSSDFSARLAGSLGLPFAFAHHFSPRGTEIATQIYRHSFRPSKWLSAPYTMVAVTAVCADTDEQAHRLTGPALLAFMREHRLRLNPTQGVSTRLPSPEEAANATYSEMEQEIVRQRQSGQAVGSPATVLDCLTDLRKRTSADELMLTTLVYDPEARIRSYELIAELA